MQPSKRQKPTKYLRIAEILYFFMLALSFYLLLISRTGEAHTVWEVLNPAFMPTLFITTFLLIIILFTSEKAAYKLLFVITLSILIHSLFSIVFPAGDLSGQQIVLGRTRLIFDNAVFNGYTNWPTAAIQSRIFEWIGGMNFQIALSVVIARMFCIDIFWVHLFLVPTLWGVFTPIAAFFTTKTLGGDNGAAILSSLLVSAFPYATYFGAISVPNSLGFIFFFYALYFMLKSLDSADSKTKSFIIVMAFFSLLSHYLTGILSFSLLLLALVFRLHRGGEASLPGAVKSSIVISFLLCASLLPLSLIYLRFFRPKIYTVFTLDKFHELPMGEIVGLLFLGDLTYGFEPETVLLIIIGSVIALLSMVYLLVFKKNLSDVFRKRVLFLLAAFLMIIVDYRILKLFMTGLPLNEERLWVFQDLIAAPFVAIAAFGVYSSVSSLLKARSPSTSSFADLVRLSRGKGLRVRTLLLVLNVLISVLLGGWITLSLTAAYPQVAPLQTTSYELEAVRYIEENTREKYVVIGDVWTIYAGEVIVGVNNPRAYYFTEFNRTGYDLFVNMKQEPSADLLLRAMNLTKTAIAYFIVTQPRLGTDEFNSIVSKALQSNLQVYGPPEGFGDGKLYVFRHEKT